MSRFKYTDEEFLTAIKRSYSIAGVCRALGLAPKGGNYATIHAKIKELNADTSHFTGRLWNKGKHVVCNPAKPLSEILTSGCKYQSFKLKNRLIEEGYKEHKCECCGKTEWRGEPIPLELHHINGDHNDNHLTNLQILCPNCHAFTDNYRGLNQTRRNIPKEKIFDDEIYKVKPQNYVKPIKEKKTKEIKIKINQPKRYCEICGKELTSKQTKYCSQECVHKAQANKRPSLEDLIQAFKEYKSFTQVGKFFQVSDKAVSKWCVYYNIPSKAKELKIYISKL